MDSITHKIDRLYSDIAQEQRPEWVDELTHELREIKSLLQNLGHQKPHYATNYKNKNTDYYEFVNALREKLKADTSQERYPELIYKHRHIGADNSGLLYDKSTTKVIPKSEAFEIYRYFYEKRDEIDTLLIADRGDI